MAGAEPLQPEAARCSAEMPAASRALRRPRGPACNSRRQRGRQRPPSAAPCDCARCRGCPRARRSDAPQRCAAAMRGTQGTVRRFLRVPASLNAWPSCTRCCRSRRRGSAARARNPRTRGSTGGSTVFVVVFARCTRAGRGGPSVQLSASSGSTASTGVRECASAIADGGLGALRVSRGEPSPVQCMHADCGGTSTTRATHRVLPAAGRSSASRRRW